MRIPEQDKQNQQTCSKCGRIVGCDYRGRKHKCECNREDKTMEKFKFTYHYPVIVTADNENQAVGKAADILGTISELSLKLWLVTHVDIEPIIESSGGDLTDIN